MAIVVYSGIVYAIFQLADEHHDQLVEALVSYGAVLLEAGQSNLATNVLDYAEQATRKTKRSKEAFLT